MSDAQELLGREALSFVRSGAVVGLGSGRAAAAFIRVLGERVAGGLQVRGVPTSNASAALAREFGVPLTTLDEVESVGVTVDGADEVDPRQNLIKGYGGALVREKIVASSSERLVILVGEEKLVPMLGSRGRLPVEVLPFGLAACRRRLETMGLPSTPRRQGEELYITDNGNHILDCRVPPLQDPAATDAALAGIPGVVGTGLFVNMAPTVLVLRAGRVERMR